MKQHRIKMGILAGAACAAVALAPMAVASASLDKGKNPNSSLCVNLRSEASSSEKLGSSLIGAMESGNFATAKTALLNDMSKSQKEAGPAKAELSSSPSKVRAAFNTLISFDSQIKKAIQKSTSLEGLEKSFQTLGTNPKLVSSSKVLSAYITSECGSITKTPTT
jgi:hypothetical protein